VPSEKLRKRGVELLKRFLNDDQLYFLKSVLESDHTLTCLILAYDGNERWGQIRDFVKSNGRSISDGTFRARMMALEALGLVRSVPIDPLKKSWKLTEKGERVAELLIDFLDKLVAIMEE